MELLTALPLWTAALPFVAFTLLAMSGPVLVRRWVALDELRTNN